MLPSLVGPSSRGPAPLPFFAVALAAAVSLGSLGCAFVDRQVHLEAPQRVYDGPRILPYPAKMVLLADARRDGSRVGVVKNGLGATSASVTVPENVPVVVSHALKAQLAAAGVAITPVPDGYVAEGGELVITGAVEHLMVEPLVGWFGADMVAAARLRLDVYHHGYRYETRATGFRRIDGVTFASADEYKDALDGALGAATESATKQIIELLAAEPALLRARAVAQR